MAGKIKIIDSKYNEEDNNEEDNNEEDNNEEDNYEEDNNEEDSKSNEDSKKETPIGKIVFGDNEKELLLYNEIKEYKIYYALERSYEPKLLKSIEYLKSKLRNEFPEFMDEKDNQTFATELLPTICTVYCIIDNISFNEELDGDKFPEPSREILKIGCNFWWKLSEKSKEIESKQKKSKNLKSKKGRKPKPKKTTRKMQGTGECFASCVNFVIDNKFNKKRKNFKPKLYRNGKVIIPGIANTDFEDFYYVFRVMLDYLKPIFGPNIFPTNIISVLKNYKCRLLNENQLIILENFQEVILREKEKSGGPRNMFRKHKMKQIMSPCGLPEHAIDDILELESGIPEIAEINLNVERYTSAITIKFYRPALTTKNKKVTIKILKSAKINFDGCNSELEAVEFYYWILYILLKYKDEVIYDIENTFIPDSDTDSDALSIYDEDLEMNNADNEINDADNELLASIPSE